MINVRKRYAVVLALVTVGAVVWVMGWRDTALVDCGFATRAVLRYHYNDTTRDVEVTNADDVTALRVSLAGRTSAEFTTSGFTENVSVTMLGTHKSMTFCPSLGGAAEFLVADNGSFLHVSKEQRRTFDRIWKRYGMPFP